MRETNCLQQFTFMSLEMLTDLLSTDDILEGNPIETLEVHGWEVTGWKDRCTIGLIHICAARKVKSLMFSFHDEETILPWLDDATNLPFLYDLRHISFNGLAFYHSNLELLFEHTNVSTISLQRWKDDPTSFHVFLWCLRQYKVLDNNYSILRIDYSYPEDTIRSNNDLAERKYVDDIFARNQACFKKCQTACTILLTKRLRKEIRIDRDVCKIIASMIWKTRGMKLWQSK